MSLEVKPRQTFSKGLPLIAHGINDFNFSCVHALAKCDILLRVPATPILPMQQFCYVIESSWTDLVFCILPYQNHIYIWRVYSWEDIDAGAVQLHKTWDIWQLQNQTSFTPGKVCSLKSYQIWMKISSVHSTSRTILYLQPINKLTSQCEIRTLWTELTTNNLGLLFDMSTGYIRPLEFDNVKYARGHNQYFFTPYQLNQGREFMHTSCKAMTSEFIRRPMSTLLWADILNFVFLAKIFNFKIIIYMQLNYPNKT